MYSHFLHATMTETTIEMTSKWSFQISLLMGHYFVALKSPPSWIFGYGAYSRSTQV